MNRQASTEVAISGHQNDAPASSSCPFIIGVAGGTASGKTSVCRKIMEQLRKDVPVSRFSFFSVLCKSCAWALVHKQLLVSGVAVLLQEDEGIIINLSQDSFYRNLTQQETADIANFNFDHPNAFAFDEIIHCLSELKQCRPVEIPQYDFVTSSRTGQVPVRHADVILFDGILAFYPPALHELFDLKIFVDTDADTRLARR